MMIWRFACGAILVVLLVAAGCKGKEQTKTFSTPGGTVAVTERDEGKVKEFSMKTEEGTATFRMGEGVVPDDLGVPLYPGAAANKGGTWNMTGQTPEGGGKGFSSALLHTEDDLDTVAAFYRGKLAGRDPKEFAMDTPNGKMVTFALEEEEGGSTNVMLMSAPDEPGTRIQISRVSR